MALSLAEHNTLYSLLTEVVSTSAQFSVAQANKDAAERNLDKFLNSLQTEPEPLPKRAYNRKPKTGPDIEGFSGALKPRDEGRQS